jgi:hypothetical protein
LEHIAGFEISGQGCGAKNIFHFLLIFLDISKNWELLAYLLRFYHLFIATLSLICQGSQQVTAATDR